MPVRIAEFEP
jgi:hypothetical protein